MCVSKGASVSAFITCLITSFALLRYGKDDLHDENTVIVLYFLYVSLMQWVDFAIWSDLDCVSGLNEAATKIGPWLNHLQPSILLLLTWTILENQEGKALPLLAFFWTVFASYQNLNLDLPKCTSQFTGDECPGQQQNTCRGGLNWPWTTFPHIMYHIVMLIYGLIMWKHSHWSIIFSLFLSYIVFFIEFFKNKQGSGEMWCFWVNSIPAFTLIFQHAIL
jgi:hypothetical protein